MTRDLALLIAPDAPWLTTEEFMGLLAEGLSARLAETAPSSAVTS
jgi:isocitrate dehydrogenase